MRWQSVRLHASHQTYERLLCGIKIAPFARPNLAELLLERKHSFAIRCASVRRNCKRYICMLNLQSLQNNASTLIALFLKCALEKRANSTENCLAKFLAAWRASYSRILHMLGEDNFNCKHSSETVTFSASFVIILPTQDEQGKKKCNSFGFALSINYLESKTSTIKLNSIQNEGKF